MKPNQRSEQTKELIKYWEGRLKQLTPMINIMVSYSSLAEKLNIDDKVSHEDVYDMYAEYLYVYERLRTQPEIDFFKSHWLKIDNIYIDLSDKNLPMFYTPFIGFEGGEWAKNFITYNLHNFIQRLDDPEFDIERHFSLVKNNLIKLTEDFAERKGK